jgi:uncharacterized protein YxeA
MKKISREIIPMIPAIIILIVFVIIGYFAIRKQNTSYDLYGTFQITFSNNVKKVIKHKIGNSYEMDYDYHTKVLQHRGDRKLPHISLGDYNDYFYVQDCICIKIDTIYK